MIPQILLPRFFKWIGLVIYIFSIVYLIYNHDEIQNLNNVFDSRGYFIQIGAFLGLFFMISARLKIEDEMTTQIRTKSFQWALIIFITYQLFFMTLGFYFHDKKWFPKGAINLLLLIYLIIFYSQVYFFPWVKSKFTKNEE